MAAPNAEQTVGLMVDTIRDRILDRIDELDIEKGKLSRGKSRGYYKRVKNKDLYDSIGRLEKQLKSLKRGLGGLLTSDPNVKLKSGETWGGFVRSLLDENVKGEDLARRLGTFGSFVDQKRKLVPGKVGHHRTGLSVLRDILKDKPFDFRTKFKEIAASKGYNIGEEFVDFIDPAAHKEFTTNIAGALSKRFGWQKAQEIPQSLVQTLSERYAHAMQFGGTNPSRSGFDIPIGFLKEGFDEETLFKFSQPYLEAAKRGADAGLQIDDILTKGVWETPEDLIKQLDKVALNQTDDLVDIFGNQLGTKLSGAEKAARKVNPEVLAKMGLTEADINTGLLKGQTNRVMKAVLGSTPTGKAVRLAGGAIPVLGLGVDVTIAGASTVKATKDPSLKNVVRAGGNWLEVVDQTPLFIGPAANALIHRVTEEGYDPTKGPEGLLSMAVQGSMLTSIPSDDNLGAHLAEQQQNQLGSRGMVKYEKTKEDEDDETEYGYAPSLTLGGV